MKKLFVLLFIISIVSCQNSHSVDQESCINFLKGNLNDANSFELVEFIAVDSTWNTGTIDNPELNKTGSGTLFHIEYAMKYRANNAIGVKVLAAHQFFVEQKNHKVISDGKLQ